MRNLNLLGLLYVHVLVCCGSGFVTSFYRWGWRLTEGTTLVHSELNKLPFLQSGVTAVFCFSSSLGRGKNSLYLKNFQIEKQVFLFLFLLFCQWTRNHPWSQPTYLSIPASGSLNNHPGLVLFKHCIAALPMWLTSGGTEGNVASKWRSLLHPSNMLPLSYVPSLETVFTFRATLIARNP